MPAGVEICFFCCCLNGVVRNSLGEVWYSLPALHGFRSDRRPVPKMYLGLLLLRDLQGRRQRQLPQARVRHHEAATGVR